MSIRCWLGLHRLIPGPIRTGSKHLWLCSRCDHHEWVEL